MKCAVKNCKNCNDSMASEISFFKFPSNVALRKKWILFCCRNKSFNPNTSVICMEHFKEEDFSNKLQYDMGLAKKRLLNHVAVPSLKKVSVESERLSKHRKQRIERRENKKTVEMLLKEYEVTSALGVESSNPLSEELHDIEALVGFKEEVLPSSFTEVNSNNEIKRLRSELEFTRRENTTLRTDLRKLQSKFKALSDILEKEPSTREFHVDE